MNDKSWAIILAGGSGSRLQSATGGLPKQFLEYKGKPLYWQSAVVFSRCAFIEGLVFVFPQQYLERETARLRGLYAENDLGVPYEIAAGGETRRDSCRHGLNKTPLSCEKVFAHDAARPFITPELVCRVHAALTPEYAAVIPALSLTDTVKFIKPEGEAWIVERTPQRDKLAAVQTPQLFRADILRQAHAAAKSASLQATDDAMLLENLGYKTRLVRGEEDNIKITKPQDLRLLAADATPAMPCSGFGYDAHRFGAGRPLKIGGISIPCDYEIIAHSDGDVLLHALMDALLGCAALGDIGMHFPDTDSEWEGISSAILLDKVLTMIREKNVEILHVDLTLVAQKPHVAPWRLEIQKNIASLLSLPREHVNFKATTEEKMGFTGNLEGIKAYALVSAIRRY